MEGLVYIGMLFLVVLSYNYVRKARSRNNPNAFSIEFIVGFIYIILLFGFGVNFLFHPADWDQPIDPVDIGYSPLAHRHLITFVVFFGLFLVSGTLVLVKGRKLPPLTLVLSLIFLLIGIALGAALILQGASRTDMEFAVANTPDFIMLSTGAMTIFIAFMLILKVIRETAAVAVNKTYQNKFLQLCNQRLRDTKWQPLWVLLLLFPVFMLITALLCLFGQTPDSLIKVFTETTTWGLSQKSHPPYLGHEGHYLCTVAACGNPKIVKPVRIGQRHGNPIIVNRQLMIANAYEEMIRDYSPRFHRFVRFVYDKYGYGFSKHINTPLRSNLIYWVMKPLEWVFLLKLYLFCSNPEVKIARQYTV